MYIKKVAQKRLPPKNNSYKANKLAAIRPAHGWLMDRWHKDSLPNAMPAPYQKYAGNRSVASWVFDKEMADATERFYLKARKKIPQYIGLKQAGVVLKPDKSHANYNIKFIPLNDGISFTLQAFFTDTSRVKPVINYAKTPLIIDRICGPVKKINDTTFQVSFYRMGFNNPKRSNDIWLLASNSGDDKYKSAVQQINIRFPLINLEGEKQEITFPKIKDIKQGATSYKLLATSSAGARVYYYVKEGPAYIENHTLKFTQVPPKAKFPIKVTVVAWQYGIQGKLKSAQPVERCFYITNK